MKSLLLHVLMRDRLLATRLTLALASLIWAFKLVLLSPHHYPAVYVSVPLGILFAVHTVVLLYALHSCCRNWVTLAFDGFLGCILWTVATWAYIITSHGLPLPILSEVFSDPPFALPGQLIFSFFSWWVMVRHWSEDPRPAAPKGQANFKRDEF